MMTPLPLPRRRSRILATSVASIVAVASLLIAPSLHAATVTLTATNASGASSFASATSWSDSAAPSALNDYLVASATPNFQLRTVLNGGDVTFAGNSLSLGDGVNAGILLLKNALNATITVNDLRLNNGEIANGGGSASGTADGTFTIAGGVTLAPSTAANRINTTNGGRSIIVSAPISGSGALSIIGGGTVTLSGNNSYTGATAVNAGILSIASIKNVGGGNSSLGAVTTVANGTIALGATTTAGTLKYTGAGDATDRVINLAGTTGGATLDQSGTGTLTFTSDLTAPGTAGADNRKTLTLQGSTAGTGVILGKIVDSTLGNAGQLATSVTKNGTGTWTLSGNNNYSGTTTVNGGTLSITGSNSSGGAVNVNAGILNLQNSNALGTSVVTAANRNSGIQLQGDITLPSTATFVISNDGTATVPYAIRNVSGNNTINGAISLTVGGGNSAIQSDSGALTLAGNITIAAGQTSRGIILQGASTGPNTFSGALSDLSGTSTASMTKNGAGTWTLSGNNTYTGATTVNAGSLLINGTHTGNGAVSVTAGTLGGVGSLNSTVTVGNSLGTADSLITGGSLLTVGTLTSSNALSLNSDAAFSLQLDSTGGIGSFDKLVFAGITLDPSSTLSILDIASIAAALPVDAVFTILDNTSGSLISGTFAGLPEGGVVGSGINQFKVSYLGGTGNDMTLTVVPEPSALTAVLGGLGMLVGFRRRRA